MKPRKDLSAVVRAALPGILALGLVALSMGGCDLSSVVPDPDTAGNNTIGGNNNAAAVPPPQPVFTKPIGNVTAPAGMPVPVSWFATSDSKTVVSQLYYDKDGLKNSGDEVLLTQASKVAKDYTANTFTWDTTGALLGTYHLLVVASDGVNTPVTVYSNYTVTVVDSTPDIEVTEPFSPVSVTPAENVVLKWTQYAPLGPSTVTLYYDDDINRANGYVAQIATLNQAASSTGGSYVWNVPAIPAGQYYILAELDYGTGTIFSYSAAPMGVSGPAVQLLNPSSPVTWHGGGQLSIRYQVVGAKSGTTITLFYEDNGGTKTNLVTLPVASSNPASWTWTSGPLPTSNPYKIGGMVDDGINDPATMIAYALGTVTDNGPTFQITAPTGATTVHALDVVPVTFAYLMNGGTATVNFYLDNDTNSANGYSGGLIPGGTVSNLQPTATTGSINLTIPVLSVGTYYIAGEFDNGTTQIVDYVGGGPGVTITVIGPQLNLTEPTLNGNILPGTAVTIGWSNTIPDGATNPTSPKVWMFYTTDKADDTTYQDIIAQAANANPNTINSSSRTQSWTIPDDLTGGPWYIGAIVTDEDGNTTPATWAPCALTMVTRNFFARDLGLTEGTAALSYTDALGRTFRGFSPNGRLGEVATSVPWVRTKPDPKNPGGNTVMRQPGISTNDDPNDDFVVVAPHGDPFYLDRKAAGEAYLILADEDKLLTPPAVGAFNPVSVNATGTDLLPGTMFPGPASATLVSIDQANDLEAVTVPGVTDGIGGVAMSRDPRPVAGKNNPAIVFGIPRVNKWFKEEQDYDPWDDFLWTLQTNDAVPPTDDQHFYVGYTKPVYRWPETSNATNPDGRYPLSTEFSGWYTIESGAMVVVSGDNPPLKTVTSQPAPQQTIVPLDDVGMISHDPHPRVVEWPTAPFPTDSSGTGGPQGIRAYPFSWAYNGLDTGWPSYGGYPLRLLDGWDGHDASRFGSSIAEADLDGDGLPEWIVAQPKTIAGNSAPGSLHVFWSQVATLWDTQSTADLVWQNASLTVTGTQVTISGTPPNQTTATSGLARQTSTPPMAPRVYSWPYAVTVGDEPGNATVELTRTADQDAKTVVYGMDSDNRDRGYAYPMMVDLIGGDSADGPAGNLSGLATVGDFNEDGREDFTVGAPNAAPGGKVNAGCVYLVYGKPDFGTHSLADIGKLDSTALAGVKIRGGAANDLLGTSQAAAGDFNGDRIPDWIVGAPGYRLSGDQAGDTRGAVAIIFGQPFLQGVFDWSDIGTAKLAGVVFTGEAATSRAGVSVAGIGDVDGDGYDDVVVIASGMSWTLGNGTTRTAAGIAYLIYGGPNFTGTISLDQVGKGSLPGMIYVGPHDGEPLATAAPAGDVNNDGFADFLIGNPNYNVLDPLGNVLSPKVGEVYLIRGGTRLTP